MDWQKIISDIQAFGLSQAEVAERVGKSQAWVSAAAQGKYIDLRWADGQALIVLLDLLRGTVAVDVAETAKTEATKEAA